MFTSQLDTGYIEWGDDEELSIKETGTANYKGELIQEVVLTNGDKERHVCYI